LEAGHSPPGFRIEAFFLGRQSRPAYFELLFWPASEKRFKIWPGKEAQGFMVDNREKKTPRSLFWKKSSNSIGTKK